MAPGYHPLVPVEDDQRTVGGAPESGPEREAAPVRGDFHGPAGDMPVKEHLVGIQLRRLVAVGVLEH